MKSIIKILLILGVTAYLGYAVFQLCKPADDLLCTGVTVQLADTTDTHLIDEEGVINLLRQKKIIPEGNPFSSIDMAAIDSLLTTSPYIASAHCNSTPSGYLNIDVELCHPILHVIPDNGGEFLLGRNGEIMPVGGVVNNLCIVTGKVGKKFASEQLLELGNFLLDDDYWRLQAEQVVVTSKGHVEIVPRISGHIIQLGRPTGVEEKLGRVRTFYEQGMPKAGWNIYKTINAAYKDQIICTK